MKITTLFWQSRVQFRLKVMVDQSSISLTRSHIHTVDVKVLSKIVVFDVTHDQAHALYSCRGVKSPALHT